MDDVYQRPRSVAILAPGITYECFYQANPVFIRPLSIHWHSEPDLGESSSWANLCCGDIKVN